MLESCGIIKAGVLGVLALFPSAISRYFLNVVLAVSRITMHLKSLVGEFN